MCDKLVFRTVTLICVILTFAPSDTSAALSPDYADLIYELWSGNDRTELLSALLREAGLKEISEREIYVEVLLNPVSHENWARGVLSIGASDEITLAVASCVIASNMETQTEQLSPTTGVFRRYLERNPRFYITGDLLMRLDQCVDGEMPVYRNLPDNARRLLPGLHSDLSDEELEELRGALRDEMNAAAEGAGSFSIAGLYLDIYLAQTGDVAPLQTLWDTEGRYRGAARTTAFRRAIAVRGSEEVTEFGLALIRDAIFKDEESHESEIIHPNYLITFITEHGGEAQVQEFVRSLFENGNLGRLYNYTDSLLEVIQRSGDVQLLMEIESQLARFHSACSDAIQNLREQGRSE